VSDCAHTAVLLDKQPLWLEAVEAVVIRTGVRVVGRATTPTEALDLIQEHLPDIFVTDIQTEPGELDGLACIQQARSLAPGVRTVVLSSQTDCVERALSAGAVAYVFKSAHPDDLSSAVRQAFRASVYFAAPQPIAPQAEVPEATLDLTSREREILQLVAEGYSNAKLAKMLWVTEQTIKFHLSNVYRKLNVANRTEAARWAQVNGLLPSPSVHAREDLRPRLVAG
jgi:DNA-binding NarL/FixJ family response regulator